jgi:hypothetical protein
MASKARLPVRVNRVDFACPQHVWLGDIFGTRVIGFAGSSALSALFWLGPGLLKFCVHVACRANHLLRSKAVQPLAEKICPCAVGQITFTPSRHPVPSRGAARNRHERGAGCGGRWSRRKACAETSGRRSRVVLAPRRWRQVGDDCFGNRAVDGDNKPGSPGRARSKPLKPLRRECRVYPVNLW